MMFVLPVLMGLAVAQHAAPTSRCSAMARFVADLRINVTRDPVSAAQHLSTAWSAQHGWLDVDSLFATSEQRATLAQCAEVHREGAAAVLERLHASASRALHNQHRMAHTSAAHGLSRLAQGRQACQRP